MLNFFYFKFFFLFVYFFSSLNVFNENDYDIVLCLHKMHFTNVFIFRVNVVGLIVFMIFFRYIFRLIFLFNFEFYIFKIRIDFQMKNCKII